MIVVDTNVIAYLFIPGDRTSHARDALRKDPEWVAPLLWRSEFLNILAFYLRQGQILLRYANQLMQEAERLMKGGEYQVPSNEVLSLVETSGCSAYDCEFVALAKEMEIPLVTTDKRLIKAFPSLAIHVTNFIS
ncbi:MAG: type II toxin-antitoxin system VapC family toxin [Candidatus Aminicenantes bacterium]|nr:MAG: type II toxin-antitoxin system VapC family toxin [Candidatus Aminicenantes bacterium]